MNRLRKIFASTAMAVVLSSSVMAQTVNDGREAYDRKDYATAYRIFKPLAEKKDGDAQVWVGFMYQYGFGVVQDDKEAVKWYQIAANQGNAFGQFNLGVMYQNGRSVVQDDKEAAKWFQLAANQGNATAQNYVGWMYEHGRGVVQDDKEAVKWYRLAANQGNAEAVKWFQLAANQGNAKAQNYLGDMYLAGRGVIRDQKEALKWYQLGANQGNADSQNSIGLIYRYGLGVVKNDLEAAKWFQLSANQGNASGQRSLGEMYRDGLGVARDDKEAVKWYQLAIKNGNCDASNDLISIALRAVQRRDFSTAQNIANMMFDAGNVAGAVGFGEWYEFGTGVEKDYRKALEFYSIAAAHGHGIAQWKVGRFFERGLEVKQSNIHAFLWYDISDYEYTKELRDKVAKRMSQSDLSQAQEMAKKCVASRYKECGLPEYITINADAKKFVKKECLNR